MFVLLHFHNQHLVTIMHLSRCLLVDTSARDKRERERERAKGNRGKKEERERGRAHSALSGEVHPHSLKRTFSELRSTVHSSLRLEWRLSQLSKSVGEGVPVVGVSSVGEGVPVVGVSSVGEGVPVVGVSSVVVGGSFNDDISFKCTTFRL